MIRTQMEIAQEWFQFVDQYWWTPAGIKNPPTLSPSVETVMEMLEESWDLGDPDRAWSEIERVTKKRLEMSNTETAVATKLCGQILLAMQNREGTERLIRQALISMPHSEKHMVAVLTWMYGIIQWLRPGRHTEAINDWKESISLFYEISRDPATGMNKKNWYIAQLRIMRDALRKAIRIDQLPPLGGVQGIFVPIPVPREFGGRAPKDEDEDEEDLRDFESSPEPTDTPEDKIELPEELKRQRKPETQEEETPPDEEDEDEEPEQQEVHRPEPPTEKKSPPEESPEEEHIRDIRMLPLPDQPDEDENGMIPIDEDILPPDTSPVSIYVQEFLELVQVKDKIITGEFDDIEQSSDMPFVEIPIVRIGFRDYNINFLGKWSKKRSINIYSKEFYFLKTKGKSMNAAGIEDGDYVLIRKQTTAENGDIVAAVIRDEDDPQRSKATLKKFLTVQGDGKNKKNMIILKAVSHEDKFKGKEWPFSPEQQNEEDGFTIHGVVVAILKPIKKKTT